MRAIYVLLVSFCLVLSFRAKAQLSVVIEQSPSYTPAEDTLYLVGSFNDWNPQDSNFLFKPLSDGRYLYDFLTPLPDFEFKITRGSWQTVEGGEMGEAIGNRTYQSTGELRDTIRLVIQSWEDLQTVIPFYDTVQIRIAQIPENTPIDATLYAVGNFNGWSPADPDFKLLANDDGTYTATIPLRSDTMEFKISRGSWAAIESRKNGLALPNRQYIVGKDDPEEIQQINIANWEDLSGNQLRWHSFVLLLAGIQCILLLFAINSFKVSKGVANYLLSALIVLVAFTFFARLGAFNRATFQTFPKIILLPDLIYFLYPPLFWLYLQALLDELKQNRSLLWHFLPFALATIAYVPLLLKNDFEFTSLVVTQELKSFFIAVAVLGWCLGLFYWIKSYRLYRKLEVGEDAINRSSLNFIATMLLVQACCLLTWGSTYLVGGIGWSLAADWVGVTDVMTDTSWVVFACGVFAMSYYVIRQPSFFRNPQLRLSPKNEGVIQEPVVATNTKEMVEPIGATAVDTSEEKEVKENPSVSTDQLQRLEALMKAEKPFLNPGLSLSKLADLVGLPSHQLSKTINDGFQKNFFDYINTYRIEAFKERISKGEHLERTILSIALDVGFNSKTAFNRAFKKHTQLTPRQYLRQEKED